jgi:hypothetical protein
MKGLAMQGFLFSMDLPETLGRCVGWQKHVLLPDFMLSFRS